MNATQKLVRDVESAREIAQTAKLALQAAQTKAATLTASAKQAKAALKIARKLAKAAKHASKEAQASVLSAEKTFKKVAKKALKLEATLSKQRKQRIPTEQKRAAAQALAKPKSPRLKSAPKPGVMPAQPVSSAPASVGTEKPSPTAINV